MAPRKVKHASFGLSTDPDGEDALPSSQAQSEVNVLNKAREMLAESKRRRNGKRKAIENDHEKQAKALRGRIKTTFETRKTKVTKLQTAEWEKLDTLNQKRVALERQILTSMRLIYQHTSNMTCELTVMLEGRMKDVSDESVDELGQ